MKYVQSLTMQVIKRDQREQFAINAEHINIEYPKSESLKEMAESLLANLNEISGKIYLLWNNFIALVQTAPRGIIELLKAENIKVDKEIWGESFYHD